MSYHAVIAVSLFYIALIIYKYPWLFQQNEIQSKIYSKKESPEVELNEIEFQENNVSEENEDEKEVQIIAKIQKVMSEQKLYKNPNLSLNDLAEAISESRNTISFVLNNHLNKSFYNYVNELRIEESKNLLSDENMQHFSIEGIAAQSGFKTMSVFYKFFKDTENVTPAVYRKQWTNP